MDFNKSCEELRGFKLPLSGTPIQYYLCDHCGFCFAPEIYQWSFAEFESRIYNAQYVLVDPDYQLVRPQNNAKLIHQLFGNGQSGLRHLDYGGGSGLLSDQLNQRGWNSLTYDPFATADLKIEDLGTFDLVTAFEVFEHVPKVDALFSDLRALCKPDGLILFSTLLSDGEISRGQPLTWWYASPRNGHISLFSDTSMQFCLQKHGLQMRSFNPNVHFAYQRLPTWASHLPHAALPLKHPAPPTAQEQQFQSALSLHQAGQLGPAQAQYEALLRSFPEHADAWHFLGLISIQSNAPQRGVDLIGKAIAINPNHPFYYINYGNALRTLQRLEDAVASFDKAIVAKPDFADAFVLRGNCLQDLQQFDAAVASFSQALALRPQDLAACFNRGNALKALGQLEAAIASFDQAIAIEPQLAGAYVNRGLALHDLKQYTAAAASFAQAIGIDGNFAEAYFNRGLALQACEPAEAHLDEAIAMFDKACQLLPDGPLTHLTHARALARAQRFKEAEGAARRALAADPVDSCGAGMFLAGLGVAPMPERIPDALLHKLYNERATTWDSGENSHYQGAALVGQALLTRRSTEPLDVLDAGCGTGMVGSLVRPRAGRLVGVDMSQPMLDRAQKKGDYGALVCGDLVAYLAAHPLAFDAVVSAATLIHFASLRPIFDGAAAALRPHGLFIFTVFPNDKDPSAFGVDHLDGMAQGGCYVHGRQYLEALAGETGFLVDAMEEQIHEYEANGKAKICLLVTLVRAA